MNRNAKYWAAGIAAAVLIVLIVIIAAAGRGEKGDSTSDTTLANLESESQALENGNAASGADSSTDHNSHTSGAADASTDDNVNRYLHSQDEIMMKMMHDMENIQKSGNASVDFLRGMIPHHESAIDMAESYLEYGGDKGELKELAQNIITTQTDEIRQMQDLIEKYENEGHTDEDQENAYLDEYDKMLDHDHTMEKSGTDSLDHAFAEGMIMHHQMAVDMAKSILEYSDYEEIRTLAQNIIDAQEKEIEEMRAYIH